MSEPHTSPPPTGDETLPEESGEALQFDQAEFATPAGSGPACTVCKQPILDQYYELNGKVLCAGAARGSRRRSGAVHGSVGRSRP